MADNSVNPTWRSPASWTAWHWAGLVAAFALVVWAGLQLISFGYDPLYSLAWGQTIAEGKKPDVLHELAPLAHPLPIGIGAVLSLLGPSAAYDIATVLAAFAYVLMGYAVYRLIKVIVRSPEHNMAIAAGAIGVVIILTRVRIDFYALKGTVEIPFTALLLLAVSFVYEDPRRRPWIPLALLLPAGLLRPESWALGVAFLLWLAYDGLRGRDLNICAGLAAAPIVIWLVFAGTFSGDPLSPITGNPDAVSIESLGFTNPASYEEGGFWFDQTTEILDAAVDNVRAMLGDELAIFFLFFTVAVALPLVKPENRTPARLRLAALAALIVALTVQSMVLAKLGAPLVERYIYPVSVMIVVFVVAVIFVAARLRTAVWIGAVLVVLVLTGSLSGRHPTWPTLSKVRDKTGFSIDERNEHEDLYTLTGLTEVRRTVRPCNKVKIGGRGGIYNVLFAKPLIAHGLERDPQLVSAERSPRGKLTASNFRRKLPHGPEPYIKEGFWVFRSPCLQEDYLTKGKLAERRGLVKEKKKAKGTKGEKGKKQPDEQKKSPENKDETKKK